MTTPLNFDQEPSELSTDQRKRHEEFVDLFGQFIFWLRNWSLRASRRLIESEESRENIGAIRSKPYDQISKMSAEEKEATLLVAEDTLNGFLERLLWSLGNEGTDSRFGRQHAYRFRVEMEVIDIESQKVVHSEPINRGGRFFGKHWSRWLNRHQDK